MLKKNKNGKRKYQWQVSYLDIQKKKTKKNIGQNGNKKTCFGPMVILNKP